MNFESLNIEAVAYGPDKGKLKTQLCITGKGSRIWMDLPIDVGNKIIQLAKNALIDGVEESANNLIFELTTDIPDNVEPESSVKK
jgi:carbon monoxide dehydrogenase subunit G